ncbi:MAG: right-handed parallel beta-helix repeat-containing protein [Planctomycetes bacterium]|nr:right-handed parallel beta-helix repeat-containing protein [Planctomycetota bacterium]
MPRARRTASITLHVSPQGDDRWSGLPAAPTADRRDGPVRTPARAQALLRALRKGGPGAPAQVLLRAGTYELEAPLVFGPADGGSAKAPVTWAAFPGERAVLSGGRRLEGFAESSVDGKPCWALDLPEVRSGAWNFHQLWRGAERLERPRLPATGTFQFAGLDGQGDSGFDWGNGPERAEYRAGDLRAFRNLADVKIVALQLWFDMHLRPVAVDEQRRVVRFAAKAIGSLRDEKREPARYWVENVREALAPGQWYLDRAEGRLYYLPRPGEQLAAFAPTAPRLPELVRFAGGVSDLRLERLVLAHNDWERAPANSGAVQAAFDVPGAVVLEHAERCALYACELAHLGTYAIEVQSPSHANTIAACALHDLGAGGVAVGHEELAPHTPAVGVPQQPLNDRPLATTIADCTIRDCGRRYLSGIGVLIGNSGGNRVLRNEISHIRYTGISCGWIWGYQRSRTVGNRIEGNHVHHINHDRILSDNGGIYTLGRHPGSTISGNHLHDIACYGYGGWGIYLDEGSSEFLVEGNLVHRTGGPAFFMHYGRAVQARGNVLAAGDGHFNLGRMEQQRSCTLDRNLVLVQSGQMQAACGCSPDHVLWARNLVFDPRGEPRCGDRLLSSLAGEGQHRGLVAADPLLLDPAGGDFRAMPGSPALALRVKPLDPALAGPRRKPLPASFAAWKPPLVRERPAVETTIEVLQGLAPAAGALSARLRVAVENRGPRAARGALRADAGAAVVAGLPSTLRLGPGQRWEGEVTVSARAGTRAIAVEVAAALPGAVPHRVRLQARGAVQVPRVSTARTAADAARLLAGLPGQPLTSLGGKCRGELRLGLAGDRLALLATVLDSDPVAASTPWEGSVLEIFAYQDEKAPKGQVFLVPAVGSEPARMQHVDGRGLPASEGGELATRAVPGGWEVAAVIPAAALHLADLVRPFLVEAAATGIDAADGIRCRAHWIGAASPHSSSDGCAQVETVVIPGLD